jgi:hypothetical protein
MKVWLVIPLVEWGERIWGEIKVFNTKASAKSYSEFMENNSKEPIEYRVEEKKVVEEPKSNLKVSGTTLGKSPRIPDYWRAEY